MQAPFDIAADLDTPVSAFLKLGPLSKAANASRAIRSWVLAMRSSCAWMPPA
jgi:hypothetical protein